ncbi:MAG: peptidoglycan DD-metalloendopeptidase family protein [Gammaproteobacteria bacterium]
MGAWWTGRVWLACVVLWSLVACHSVPRAPVEQKLPPRDARPGVSRDAQPAAPVKPTVSRPTVHTVVRGDTLHGIAFRHGLDYRDLVRWNRIRNPDLIFVGQRLRLTPPTPVTAAAKPTPQATAPAPRPVPQSPARAASPPAAKAASPAPRAAPGALAWNWPSSGKATRATSVTGNRGLEIRGTRGEAVKAAADGAVVYSGSGLRGYGELIIIKHNDTFLSAYAHNESRLVQEGQRVKGGQLIARMGDTEAREVMLHFEIRRNGKSVDPLQYLPRR